MYAIFNFRSRTYSHGRLNRDENRRFTLLFLNMTFHTMNGNSTTKASTYCVVAHARRENQLFRHNNI